MRGVCFGAVIVCAVQICPPAYAATCDTAANDIINTAVGGAITASKAAFEAIPKSSAEAGGGYVKFFGAYSDARRDAVKAVLSQVIASLVVGDLKFQCDANSTTNCQGTKNPWAWVEPSNPYEIHFCQRFIDGVADERAPLLVHEMSHFIPTKTDDFCGTEAECEALAKNDPDKAVKSAASYQLFVYDFQ